MWLCIMVPVDLSDFDQLEVGAFRRRENGLTFYKVWVTFDGFWSRFLASSCELARCVLSTFLFRPRNNDIGIQWITLDKLFHCLIPIRGVGIFEFELRLLTWNFETGILDVFSETKYAVISFLAPFWSCPTRGEKVISGRFVHAKRTPSCALWKWLLVVLRRFRSRQGICHRLPCLRRWRLH